MRKLLFSRGFVPFAKSAPQSNFRSYCKLLVCYLRPEALGKRVIFMRSDIQQKALYWNTEGLPDEFRKHIISQITGNFVWNVLQQLRRSDVDPGIRPAAPGMRWLFLKMNNPAVGIRHNDATGGWVWGLKQGAGKHTLFFPVEFEQVRKIRVRQII